MKVRDEVVELAISQARKSPMRYRHGSVIWKSNKIIGAGYNWPVAPPGGNKKRFSIHSERDALKGLRLEQTYGASLLCVRITQKKESLASSMPCSGCMGLLRRRGLVNVFWFDSDGILNKIYLRG